eukprot:3596217-Prymnesium_polylepis.1
MALVAEQPSAHSGSVNSVGFSPDGTRIVSDSFDYSVKVWGGLRLLTLCCRAKPVRGPDACRRSRCGPAPHEGL